jgi:hypothetical protein
MADTERLSGTVIMRREWRALGRFALEGLAAGLVVSLVLALVVYIVSSPAHAGQPKPPVNHLLLPGHYDGDVGSLDAPLSSMPDTGWFVLVKDAAGSYLDRIPDDASGRPALLRELESASLANAATLQSALGQLYYLHLPRAALQPGPLAEVGLRRRALVPVNGRAYALALQSTPFTLTVHNGYHGRAGAHYVIERAGVRHEYLLDGFGWDSEVQYAGDIDRDGAPDLIVYVNGNNAGAWYLLLSGEAKPGLNPPSAKLTVQGC